MRTKTFNGKLIQVKGSFDLTREEWQRVIDSLSAMGSLDGPALDQAITSLAHLLTPELEVPADYDRTELFGILIGDDFFSEIAAFQDRFMAAFRALVTKEFERRVKAL